MTVSGSTRCCNDDTGVGSATGRRFEEVHMAAFDPQEMIARFRDRAQAVRKRPLPPVAGEERQLFLSQMQTDYQDFAMIGDAVATLEDGVLVLRVDLRPKQ